MALIRGILGLILAILLAIFAVANRQAVDVVWSPIHPAINIPVYALVLVALALGFMIGGFLTWLSALPVRIERGRQSRKIKTLEKELGTAQQPGNHDTVIEGLTMLPGSSGKTT